MGRGTSDQLGHGEMVNVLKPKMVESLKSLVIFHVAAGWNHSEFVTDTRLLYTCGDGSFGQLGHGDFQSHCSPKAVSYFSSKHVVQIACGMRHSIALVKDENKGDKLYSFGSARRGQLGVSDERLKSVNEPRAILRLEGVQISRLCAWGDHSAALSTDGELYIWGRGFSGRSDVYIPQQVNTGLCFAQVCLGWNHALLLTGDGEVNHKDVELERVQTGITRVLQIASGAEHSALVTEGGEILAWGWGEHGQLGFGNTSDEKTPRRVSICSKATNERTIPRVYCGSGFTYAVKCLSLSTIRICTKTCSKLS